MYMYEPKEKLPIVITKQKPPSMSACNRLSGVALSYSAVTVQSLSSKRDLNRSYIERATTIYQESLDAESGRFFSALQIKRVMINLL